METRFAGDCDIRDFGAVADAKTVNTKAIQTAIDFCSENGGGRVRVSGGEFLTGTLFMKSNVSLCIEAGAKLSASCNLEDYSKNVHKNMYRGESHMDLCLIFAKDVRNISFEGLGAIDGRGSEFPLASDERRNRPMLLRLLNCTKVRMRDLTLQNPASWTSAWLYCDDIVVDSVTFSARANGNGDGLDFDGCSNVRVANCSFDTSDDSICLQTSRQDRPCRNVAIINSVFKSKWAAMRIGLLSRGDIENVAVSNCVFEGVSDAGLKIQMNEGAAIRNMSFSNISMKNIARPIFMTLSSVRACVDAPMEVPPVGKIENISFSNLQIDNSDMGKNTGIIISAVEGSYIENVALSNISMVVSGGGASEDSKGEIGEFKKLKSWPEFSVLARMPASGIFLRHVDGARISGLNLRTVRGDERSGIVALDVKNLQSDSGVSLEKRDKK